MAIPTETRRSEYLSGKVQLQTLPVYEGSAGPGAPILKRLSLPQGELAQMYDAEEGIHYIAFIELRPGSDRGHHYHKVKKEYLYLIRGEVLLILEDIQSNARETVPMRSGDLMIIATGVAHAVRPLTAGEAIEFSPARFDVADIHRYPLALEPV